MEDTQKSLKRICKFCLPLKHQCIQDELNNYLKGFKIVKIQRNKSVYDCKLEREDETISLRIDNYSIFILRKHECFTDKIVIDDKGNCHQRKVEKREKGFVITDITKDYDFSKRFDNKLVLVDLKENRYVLTNEKVKKILKNEDLNKISLISLSLKLYPKNIAEFSDLTTIFSTHMNYYYSSLDFREIKNNIYPTKTYFNDEEISHLYDLVDGHDKLYRIHDLYNGLINNRDKTDIHTIHLGLLTKSGFDLRTLKGITEQENALIGESLIPVSDEYKSYLKQLFEIKYGYKDEIKLDRESLLNTIDYVMPTEIANSHEQDENLSDEQLKEKTEQYFVALPKIVLKKIKTKFQKK